MKRVKREKFVAPYPGSQIQLQKHPDQNKVKVNAKTILSLPE